MCHLKIKLKKYISFFELYFKARYEIFITGTVKTTGIWDVIFYTITLITMFVPTYSV